MNWWVFVALSVIEIYVVSLAILVSAVRTAPLIPDPEIQLSERR